MKLNNKGFAITTILYGTLILFLMLLLSMLGILSTYKGRLEKLIDSNNGARDIIEGDFVSVTPDAGGDAGTVDSDSGEDTGVSDGSWTEDFADANIVSQLTIDTPKVGSEISYCSWGVNASNGVFSSHSCNTSTPSASVLSSQEIATITFNVPDDGNSYNLSMTTRTPTVTAVSIISEYSIVLYDANDTEFTAPLYTFFEYSNTTFAQLKAGISLGMDVIPAGDYTILLTYTANGNYLAYIDDLTLTKIS